LTKNKDVHNINIKSAPARVMQCMSWHLRQKSAVDSVRSL